MDQAHADQYSRIMRFNSKLESLSQTISSEKKTTLGRYEQLLSQLHEKVSSIQRTSNTVRWTREGPCG